MKQFLAMLALLAAVGAAQADAVDKLRDFVRNVKSGRSAFTQTVTAPDGSRGKLSSGAFEFQRPDRFRFDYLKPYPQQIVGDGQKVWMFDPDLNQVSVRAYDKALGATPAALLAGASLDTDFDLTAQPARDGLDWVRATPKVRDGGFQWMAVGFRGATLATVEILDRFDQRTLLRLENFEPQVPLAAERFRFTPPPGADVVQQ
jgi:outer membrane lipoprotein carrier protein